MSTPVGQLVIEMAANNVRLQKDMDRANKLVSDAMGKIRKSADGAMSALGALGIGVSIGAFSSWIKGAIDAIDRLNDISAATGITVTKLAGLDYAAKLSGTSLDTVTEASNKLQLGLATNNAALASIGVTAQDPVEALAQLADVYAATEGQANKAAVANLALGKSWQGVAGLLAQGGDNMRRLITEGEALSGVTQETADDAAKFNDEIDRLSTRLSALALNIAGPVLKVFSNWIDQLNEGTKAAGGFWKAIGMFGRANPFLNLEESAAKYRKEVEELTAKQEKYGELASIALGVNDKLAEAAKKLAYFEAMVAIETRKATAAQAESASGSNAHVIAYNAMIGSAEDLVKQMRFELALIGQTNEERAVSLALRKLEELGIRSGTEAFEKYGNLIIEIQRQIRIKTKSTELSKQAADSAKREAEEYDRLLKSFQDQIAKMQLENETYFDGNAARERAIFLRETENLKIEDRSRLLAQYDEAAAVKEANEARKKGVELQLKQQEDYAKEMEKINDQIGQSLTDALMEGGRNAKDLLMNLFKTMILRPLLQPVINGVVGTFTSAGLAGAAAAQETSGGAVGSSLGLVGLANGLKSAYEMVTGGFSQIGTMASSLASTFEVASTYGTGLLSQQTAMLAAQEAGMTSFSAAAGTAASALAGIGAGLMVGNLISDGKGIGGGSSWLTVGGGAAAGAALGSIFPGVGTALGAALGAALGGVVGGLANAAFGTGKKKIDDTGLKITFNSMGNTIKQYEDWSKKGGWFGGGGKGTDLKEVDSELQKYFDVSVGAVALSVRQYTDILKLPARDLTQYSLDIEKSLEGLSPEEQKKAIDESIKAYADGLSGFAAAEIAPFQRSGEALSDTLARLGGSLKTVNDTFGILNIALYDSSAAGADAASKLADAFGGLDKLVAATDVYYQNFYSAQERADKTTESLTKVFAELGLQLPSTNAQFREMVEAARAAGNDTLFANLIKLAPAFSNLKNSLAALVDSAFQDLQAAIQREQKAALDAIEKQKQVAEAQRQVAQENVDSLTSIFDYLTTQINELSGATSAAQSAAEGRAFISNAVEAARNTGYLPDQKALEQAVTSVRTAIEQTDYASSYEQKLAQMQLAGQLSDLNNIAFEQKTTAELQLEVATQQINDLNAQAALTNAFYESQLIYAQDQINELKNVNGSVLTVAGAMAALGAAIEASKMQASAGGGGGGGGGGGDNSRTGQINGLYQEILGRNAEEGGLNAWAGSGLSIDQIREGIMNSPEAQARGYATGGYYPGGLAMVGEQGPELINFNRPGQVYTASQTSEILAGGNLASEIQALREENRAQSRAMVQMQGRMTKMLERWESSGLPETRVEA
jgi:hypothetical protein